MSSDPIEAASHESALGELGYGLRREDFADLDALIDIAAARNYTHAAARLGLTQSSLTYAVQRLERRAGTRLLNRTTRKVSATEAGARLIQAAEPAFRQIREVFATLRNVPAEITGDVSIAAPAGTARALLWPTVRSLIETHPQVRVRIIERDTSQGTLIDGLDAIVTFAQQHGPGLTSVRIGPDVPMVTAASAGYIERYGEPTRPEDLANHRCVALVDADATGTVRWHFNRRGRNLVVFPEPVFTSSDSRMVLEAVRDGSGIAYLPESSLLDWPGGEPPIRCLSGWAAALDGPYLSFASDRVAAAAFSLVLERLQWRKPEADG